VLVAQVSVPLIHWEFQETTLYLELSPQLVAVAVAITNRMVLLVVLAVVVVEEIIAQEVLALQIRALQVQIH
jgi:hypothetical protein